MRPACPAVRRAAAAAAVVTLLLPLPLRTLADDSWTIHDGVPDVDNIDSHGAVCRGHLVDEGAGRRLSMCISTRGATAVSVALPDSSAGRGARTYSVHKRSLRSTTQREPAHPRQLLQQLK